MSSAVDYQRERGCHAAYEMLLKFRSLCISGYCVFGCQGNCPHVKQIDSGVQRNFSSLPSAFVLPNRAALCLGERVMAFLPRCADTNFVVREFSVQALDLFFSISLSLSRPLNSSIGMDIEQAYSALTSLEDVIAILRSDASIDPSEVFSRVVSSVSILLTKDELAAALQGCSTALCDKVKQSAECSIQAVVEFITKRGSVLSEVDISRTTQALLSATVHVSEKYLRQEILGAISTLAENTNSKIVFNEVLAAAGRDISTKDISRLRGGWSVQDVFYTFSQHAILSSSFLEHVVTLANTTPFFNGDLGKGESTSQSVDTSIEEAISQAAVIALTAFFRGGGKVGKKAVEQNYASVLATLVLHFGNCHCLALSGQLEPLRTLLIAFHAFCECVGDLEMGKILARDGEQSENEKWINVVGDLAGCVSLKRPKEVPTICLLLSKSLGRPEMFQREAAAAAVSEFVRYSSGFCSLLEQMVEALCQHVSDVSPVVRRLCLRGLVQMPSIHALHYTIQILGVTLALLDDPDESVQLTSVSCLLMVLESSSNEAVEPILLNLSARLRNLQMSMNVKIRIDAFVAFGALSRYVVESQHEAFLEHVYVVFPRLVLHLHDEDLGVRQACRNTYRSIAPLVGIEGLVALCSSHRFGSDHRSDYEDLLRDLAKQFIQHLSSRVDTCMAAIIQAFDAPWPVIQANAVYFCSSMLATLDDKHMSALYYSQVFSILVGKMSRSSDAIVRATCSAALSLLLKSSHSSSWRDVRLERVESTQRGS